MLSSNKFREVPKEGTAETGQSRGWFGAALGLVLLLVFGFGLGLLVGWPSLPRKASETGVEYDISGVATCDGSRLTVQKMWLWTQSPTPLDVTQLAPYQFNSALESFEGKNSIAWASTMNLTGFTYDHVDGDTIVTKEQLSLGPTECHFTIDSNTCNPCVGECLNRMNDACYASKHAVGMDDHFLELGCDLNMGTNLYPFCCHQATDGSTC